MADRRKGLDEDHCKVVVGKLAKLHAASMALAKLDAKAMDNFSFGLIKPDTNNLLMVEIFEKGCEILADISARWPQFVDITEKLHILKVINSSKCTM